MLLVIEVAINVYYELHDALRALNRSCKHVINVWHILNARFPAGNTNDTTP
jgi:hypothetical protein